LCYGLHPHAHTENKRVETNWYEIVVSEHFLRLPIIALPYRIFAKQEGPMTTTTIPRNEWKEFLNNLSRDLLDWEVSVEVIASDIGAQTLAENIAFGGLTFEPNDGGVVELELGDTREHQAHNIFKPVEIAFESSGIGPKGALEILDSQGTKTLIRFLQPFPVLVEWTKAEIIFATK